MKLLFQEHWKLCVAVILLLIFLIAVVVILAVIGWSFFSSYNSYNNAAIEARDAERIRDVQNIRMALMIFYIENNAYPDKLADLIPKYLAEIPLDPREGKNHGSTACEKALDSNTFLYRYEPADSNGKYTLAACLDAGKVLTMFSYE